MSASCIDLRSAISAPPQLDSDRMDRALDPSRQSSPDSAGEYQTLTLLHTAPGGLGMALEEELAMLTREREEDLEVSASETPVSGQDSDLLSLFGKALLERNQDLTKQYDKMTKDLNDKLELLEQEKHELRRRLESREGEWEGQVAELETDVQHLQGELERHQVQLREADRDKSRAISELSEQNHRLLQQISRAAEVEKQLSTQVHSLRDDFKEKSLSTNQHMTRLETLQAEIKMLSERKQELERRVNAMLEENQQLQHTVEDLRERTLLLEKQCHEKDLQVSDHHTAKQTHTEELEQEREQLRLQLWEAYCQVRSICSQLRGNDITDSALSTDSSMDESSETLSAKDVPTGSLHANLLELRRLTQNLLDGNESTSSRRSEEEVLEEQVRKLSEELRELRELYEQEQEKTHNSQEEVLQLHNQVALLSVEVSSSREENEHLRAMAEVHEPNEQLQSAIRDRDEAIAKKKAVEMELAKCKIDIMSLNSQLLDAIQQKLNLSQQLEAWQDDMHRVIDQQLMDKHQEEWKDPPYSFSGSRGGAPSRRAHRLSDRDKRLFSFFKKN
ncbi:bicaudal D-related protein 1-like [Sinocyclocheilus anshuiensis]|uniref:bicaudal D-related protein 1-like n=1 Tax=Sinocyclocheilus anshuiensis TaxID=1608454 RepID=UPI0007B810A9|nr:PREDICTED: bicaudal D-related protein 1-like [Sinocyclocheilus anshuiensis]